jgi:hypothetical protein
MNITRTLPSDKLPIFFLKSDSQSQARVSEVSQDPHKQLLVKNKKITKSLLGRFTWINALIESF